MELYKAYRPESLEAVWGQEVAVKAITAKLDSDEGLPQTVMLTGPSGVGKTTIARILAAEVGCSKNAIHEINAAASRGIDQIRDIADRIAVPPLGSECQAWIIDECHQLTKEAQEGSLKILEDTPDTCFFFLCTTNPSKVLPTIRTRCTRFDLKTIDLGSLHGLILDICQEEEIVLSQNVLDSILDASGGSARQALVYLDQVRVLDDETEQLDLIHTPKDDPANKLLKLLMNTKTRWEDVTDLLLELDDDPEQFRRRLLGYASVVLLRTQKSSGPRAATILNAFSVNTYDTGKAGIVLSTWDVLDK